MTASNALTARTSSRPLYTTSVDLTLEDLLHIARRILPSVELRDVGLVVSAAARPQSSAFGADAYPSLDSKAAALLHSIARNHALVEGNKRLALAAALAFYGLNGVGMTLTNDEAYEPVVAVAVGGVGDIEVIAKRLEGKTEPVGDGATQPGPTESVSFASVEQPAAADRHRGRP